MNTNSLLRSFIYHIVFYVHLLTLQITRITLCRHRKEVITFLKNLIICIKLVMLPKT